MSQDNSGVTKTLLLATVDNAADVISPVWPLTTFIACNPLQGLEGISFKEAVKNANVLFHGKGYATKKYYQDALLQGRIDQQVFNTVFDRYCADFSAPIVIGKFTIDTKNVLYQYLTHSVEEEKDLFLASSSVKDGVTAQVNAQLIKWLTVYLDEGQANIAMPHRSKGFYSSWRELAVFDAPLHGNHSSSIQWLKNLPTDAADSLAKSLTSLGVEQNHWEKYLRENLVELAGWSGFIKWRSGERDYVPQQLAPISMMDYLAVRLAMESVYRANGGKSDERKQDHRDEQKSLMGSYLKTYAGFTEDDLQISSKTELQNWFDVFSRFQQQEMLIWLESAETTYRFSLLKSLKDSAKELTHHLEAPKRANAQLVFCIDVRSEPFRRAIEAQGTYKTFGFAGFFGVPIRFHFFDAEHSCNSCPVLLKPRHDIYEQPHGVSANRIKEYEQGKSILQYFKSLYEELKFNVSTPFALAEGIGPLCGIWMLGRTLVPSAFVEFKGRIKSKVKPEIFKRPIVGMGKNNPRLEGITFSEQALYAEASLRMMGLTENFAPLIVLSAHGSKTENNPYASALDCGACGGNHGGPNAKVMAAIFNDPEIRAQLRVRELQIPNDTLFIAAEHNTTTDEVNFLDQAPLTHLKCLEDLRQDLHKARKINSGVRCQSFGLDKYSKDSYLQTRFRSNDWAEVRPEWGLARNAAFIVGPRTLTEKINLEGRCFLHSYDWQGDPNSSSLEIILTAPMVVAQWINNQYYFSTVDNVAYGSGSKVTHNVTGRIGIMQGNASDLMHGLPLQSVFASDEKAYHEPLRLMTVVYSPREKVKSLVDKNEVLQKLFYQEWVCLTVIEPQSNEVFSLKTDGTWQKIID